MRLSYTRLGRRNTRLAVAALALAWMLCFVPAASFSADDGAKPATAAEKSQEAAAGFPTTPRKAAEAMGWPFVGAFALASLMAVWFSIERLVVLRRGRVIPKPFVERFLDHLRQRKVDQPEALKICQENDSPVANIFAHGVRKWGKPSVEVEQAIIDGGERQVSQLRKHLRVLNGIATVTPLIGLFGTVIGMIQAFVAIEASTGAGPEKLQLAIGIAQALLTTATGLAIAIPALIIYMFLAGRIDALVIAMDDLGQDVVHLISAEGLSAKIPISGEPLESNTPPPKSIGKKATARKSSA